MTQTRMTHLCRAAALALDKSLWRMCSDDENMLTQPSLLDGM